MLLKLGMAFASSWRCGSLTPVLILLLVLLRLCMAPFYGCFFLLSFPSFSAIGDLGPCSRKVYVVLNAAWLYAAMVTLFMVFAARKPGDWSCNGSSMTAEQVSRAASVGTAAPCLDSILLFCDWCHLCCRFGFHPVVGFSSLKALREASSGR